jgi:hypothetical protein
LLLFEILVAAICELYVGNSPPPAPSSPPLVSSPLTSGWLQILELDLWNGIIPSVAAMDNTCLLSSMTVYFLQRASKLDTQACGVIFP